VAHDRARLKPVGRAGAAWALVAFVLVALTRLVGVSTPPQTYFDEYLYARSADDYLRGVDVAEWTHPPVSKELMALGERWLPRFRAARCNAKPPPEPVAPFGFSITPSGDLVHRGTVLAHGASDVAAATDDRAVWAAFGVERRVQIFAADGTPGPSIAVRNEPVRVLVPSDPSKGNSPHAIRVLAAGGGRIESVDPYAKHRAGGIAATTPDTWAFDRSGIVWAVDGTRALAIDPRSLAVLGRATLPFAGRTAHERDGRIVVSDGSRVACLSGDAPLGWRFGGAIAGGAAAALALLVSWRCFGNRRAAIVAALLVCLEGLSFSMSRTAGPDAYLTAFVLVAWFAALSCLHHAGTAPRTARLWLLASGGAAGLAVSTKWIGAYALAGIVLVFVWDARVSGRAGVAGLWRTGLIAAALVPAIYLATYVPYLRAGHGVADLLGLQVRMFRWHAGAGQWQWLSSPWYWWPAGGKAILLHLATTTRARAELWSLPNPVVLLFGLVAIVAMAIVARRRRDPASALVPWAALVQYMPWAIVPRYTFIYHYLTVVPFLCIAAGWAVRRSTVATMAVVGAAAAVFLVLLPLTDGWLVAPSYLGSVRSALSWMFAVHPRP
jgi:hypothetical protein